MTDDLRALGVLAAIVLALLAIWAVLLAPVAFLIWS